MDLLLIRHGRSLADDEEKIEGGGYDSPLTHLGLEQAHKLAARLKREAYTFDVLLCSPLARAKQTAQIVSEALGIEVIYDKRLSELHLGVMSARPIGLDPKPEGFRLAHERFPEGEAFLDQINRVMSFYMELQHKRATSRICIVAHGGTLSVLITLIFGLPMSSPYWQSQRFRFQMGDTAMSRFQVNAPLDVVTRFINDTAHLR